MTVQLGLGFASGLEAGNLRFAIRVDEQGHPEVKNISRIQVCAIDSHSFNAIFNGFNVKRQRTQIPAGGVGIFHFDVDLGHLPLWSGDLYLELVAKMLTDRVWRGGTNTRVSAFSLTVWPSYLLAQSAERIFFEATILAHIQARTKEALPEWFRQGVQAQSV